METVKKLYTKLRLRYSDSNEEQEYRLLMMPLLKDIYLCLVGALTIFLIPVLVRYIDTHLYPQTYIGIGILVIAALIMVFRNYVAKYLEYLSFLVLIMLVGISIANSSIIIHNSAKPKVTLGFFTMGYCLALMHRLIGYRVIKFQYMFVFIVTTLALRLSLFGMPEFTLSFCLFTLELFTLIIGYRSERNERMLFDSLYKSKNQLLKFKHLLTEYLPNQVAIFSKDSLSTYFTNNAFQKAFKNSGNSTSQIHSSLMKFTIDTDSVLKNTQLFTRMGFNMNDSDSIDLSNFLTKLAKNPQEIKNDEIISFQITEKDQNDDGNLDFDTSRENRPTNPVNPFKLKTKKTTENHLVLHPGELLMEKNVKISTKGKSSDKFDEKSPIHITERENLVEEHASDKPIQDSGLETSIEANLRRTFKVKIFQIIWDDQEAVALLLDNVTHERTIMELKVADKNKDLVIAMISQELRTPLNGILGLVDILKKLSRQSEISPYLDACRNSGILLLSLVNSILDLSQIRSNKLSLVNSRFTIKELLNEIVPLFDYFSLIKKLYLKIDIDENVPEAVITDKNRLSQIIINLLGNAFKFTFQGGITIKASLEEEDSSKIRFFIIDTGIGIKKEDQDRLFKLFGRIEHHDKKINTNGVGLGLTIANTLAQLLGPPENKGVQVESLLDKGSTFSFVLQSKPVTHLFKKKVEENSTEDASSAVFDEEKDSQMDRKLEVYETCSFKPLSSNVIGTNIANKKSLNIGSSATELLNFPTKEGDNLVLLKNEEKPWCLIVDDNPFNLVVATHIMHDKGYQIKTALNGKDAIDVYEKCCNNDEAIKIILMDCQMPVMDGYQATKILNERMKDGTLEPCPIVALTANQMSDKFIHLCKEVGMSGWLSKPLQINELDKTLKKVQKK